MHSHPKIGDTVEHVYTVRNDKMVPDLFPESEEYRAMPRVFATGFMVGLLEWAAINALKPHLESSEDSLGTVVDIKHSAPTPAGATLTVTAQCVTSAPPYFEWRVTAVDGDGDVAADGLHGRNVIEVERFLRRVDAKAERLVGNS
ncbi:hypothetical protein QP932_03120 [Corynebacterium freneyi]|uniref:thioesterase family protein n=1 Tax=Corynebacterium freneyi TaxID=134034 RepID=UPI00254ED156|nr:hypothetical protein [Corynebacterium freneyi]MDK8767493.1 hypothetical protein [Corynebacterium freneyi]